MERDLRVRLPDDLADRLDLEVRAQDRPLSRIVRAALAAYFQALDLARTDGVCEDEESAVRG